MKKTLEVEVQTATQCSFIPFTPVPDGWAGQKVRIELVEEAPALIPAFTTGHCDMHKQAGGCPLHNLQCGWPKCDQRPTVMR